MNETNGGNETTGAVDYRALLAAIRRRFLLVLLCAIAGAGIGLGLSLIQQKQYTASASLLFREGFDQSLLGSQSLASSDPNSPAQQATNLQLVSLDAVAAKTAAKLGTSPGSISSAVQVQPQGLSNVISIVATASDPQKAAHIANTYAQTYVQFRRRADRRTVANAIQLVQRNVDALSNTTGSQAESLGRQLSRLETLKALQTGNAEVVQQATAPHAPSSPTTRRNTIVGFAVGLLFGLGLAAVLERSDRRLRRPDELESTFSWPLLGSIPDSSAFGSPNGAVNHLPAAEREAFRMVRTRLRYFNVDREVRVVMVGSPTLMDGKSTLALHLASAAAAAGTKTLLLEADFHRPVIAERTGSSAFPGLAEVVTGQTSLSTATQSLSIGDGADGGPIGHTLDVVVAGARPPNAIELLESHEMASLLDELRRMYDLVVIDTPPLGMVADAVPLTKVVDGIIIVSQLGRTTRDEAVHLRDQLERFDAPVLGVVANRTRSGRGYRHGDYYYYYGGGDKPSFRLFRRRTRQRA